MTIIVAMLVTAGAAGAQTPSATTSAPVAASSIEPGATATDHAAAATIDLLRGQLARQQRRIHELEHPAVVTGRETTTESAAGLYDRAVAKGLKMLPASRVMWFWFVVGMGGEFIFFLRFVVQWIASERAKRTVVPMTFWHLSLIGTGMVLVYALYRIDPVFILAYGLNIFLYVRNLVIAKRQPAMAALMEKASE